MLKNDTAGSAAEDRTKSALTRERILDSAAYVLSRKGFAGTRLVDVAAHAELQAPAIYYYFKSREELIEEVMFVGISNIRAHVSEVLEALDPNTRPIDRIAAAVEAHLRYELSISDYTTAAIRNGGQMPEHLRERHESVRNKYGNEWQALYQAAKDAGELREDLDVRATRMLVMGALNWAAEWWNPKRGGSLTSLVRTAQSIVLHGIASPAALAGTVADTSSAPAPEKSSTKRVAAKSNTAKAVGRRSGTKTASAKKVAAKG
ncbi:MULTISPECIES: TetR/AcrR family transcriptional regulator [Rhodococcus]|uniref:TetR/AcrR family transcriptional regulator n=1 Tax=Rhodococcus TaxID=1827 RepID=UPI0008156FB8|nr:TetR/AcrR family transcriptional regulator [Rhodococcus qingshengii]SCC66640.1 transcriptional regulator, TetR family [Rhodococcus qingshengii]